MSEHVSPTFDEDGYPDKWTLAQVSAWPIKTNADIGELLEYVSEAWRYQFCIETGSDERSYGEAVPWIEVATHGWSGNEDLVSALQENRLFWCSCWSRSYRGGRYRFITEPFPEKKP